jgi:hypothetical protein
VTVEDLPRGADQGGQRLVGGDVVVTTQRGVPRSPVLAVPPAEPAVGITQPSATSTLTFIPAS